MDSAVILADDLLPVVVRLRFIKSFQLLQEDRVVVIEICQIRIFGAQFAFQGRQRIPIVLYRLHNLALVV